MKTAKEYLGQYLTESEYIKWENNLHDLSSYNLKKFLNSEFDSLSDCISSSFVWSCTEEGHSYWQKISRYERFDRFNVTKNIGKLKGWNLKEEI